jgi:hypothetical protein
VGDIFDLQMCMSNKFCGEGYFVVKRKDRDECLASMEQRLSWDPELDAYLKREIGPVSFFRLPLFVYVGRPSCWTDLL